MIPKEKQTYIEYIQEIIQSRGQWTQLYDNEGNPILYENHHIVPRCKGGEPQSWRHETKHENLIWLTLEEHYYAHELLFFENQDDFELSNIWNLMSDRGNIDSETFVKLRTISNKLNSEHAKHQNDNLTPEELKKKYDNVAKKNKEHHCNPEEKEIILNKRRKTLQDNPQTEINRKIKEKETKDNWTESQKQEYSTKLKTAHIEKKELYSVSISQGLKNRTTEEIQQWTIKRLNTLSEKGHLKYYNKSVLCVNTNICYDSINNAAEAVGWKTTKPIKRSIETGLADSKGNTWKLL